MPELFHKLDALKSVKYVEASAVNHARASCRRGSRFRAVIPPENFIYKSLTYDN